MENVRSKHGSDSAWFVCRRRLENAHDRNHQSGRYPCHHTMGGRVSTEVKQQHRQDTIQSLRQTTVDRLTGMPKLLADGRFCDESQHAISQMHAHAQAFAARGGSTLVKGELVHMIMALRLSKGDAINFSMYAALMMRGTDELHAVLRALMYSPEILQPVLAAVTQTQGHMPLPATMHPLAAPHPASAPPADGTDKEEPEL